tara:strand:+ start:1824 stop:2105 length:282 start_codon:yes stop_codon:yes gene_type:complete
MSKKKLEKHINDFLYAYLETNPDFNELDDTDKLYVYSVLKKLLALIHKVLKYPNVYPILLVQNTKSKEIITNAFDEVAHIIPTIKNIKIQVMN